MFWPLPPPQWRLHILTYEIFSPRREFQQKISFNISHQTFHWEIPVNWGFWGEIQLDNCMENSLGKLFLISRKKIIKFQPKSVGCIFRWRFFFENSVEKLNLNFLITAFRKNSVEFLMQESKDKFSVVSTKNIIRIFRLNLTNCYGKNWTISSRQIFC